MLCYVNAVSCWVTSWLNVKFLEFFMYYETKTSERYVIFNFSLHVGPLHSIVDNFDI